MSVFSHLHFFWSEVFILISYTWLSLLLYQTTFRYHLFSFLPLPLLLLLSLILRLFDYSADFKHLIFAVFRAALWHSFKKKVVINLGLTMILDLLVIKLRSRLILKIFSSYYSSNQLISLINYSLTRCYSKSPHLIQLVLIF